MKIIYSSMELLNKPVLEINNIDDKPINIVKNIG